LRDSLGLLATRRYLIDGCTRLLIDKLPNERNVDAPRPSNIGPAAAACSNPCSASEVYIALTMLHSDTTAKAVPINKGAWKRWFPHLEALLDRIDEQAATIASI